MSGTTLAVFGYVLAQLGVAVWVSRRIRTEEDYLLAGRSLGLVLSTFTLMATWFGAETCVGAAGRAYEQGLAGTTADPFGYALCLVLVGVLFAGPLWRRGWLTLGDFYRERFGVTAERVAVILMVPTSLLWAGAQIRAFGQVLATGSAFSTSVGIAIAAGVVIVYTSFGGMLADVWTDLVQGIALIIGLSALAIAVFATLDVDLSALAPERRTLFPAERGLLSTAEAWLVPTIGSIPAQELVARVFAARTPKVAQRSAVLAGTLYLAVGLLPLGVGLVGPQLVPDLADPERVLTEIAARHLTPTLHVLFAGALVSAILSTVDSALLVAGSMIAHHFVLPALGPRGDRARVGIHRVAVATGGLVALGIALSADSVYDLVSEASAFGSSGLVVALIFGLWTRRGGQQAATAAMATGAVSYAVLAHGVGYETPFCASLLLATVAYAASGGWRRAAS